MLLFRTTVLLSVALAPLAQADQTRLKAKPGGQITIRYGAPSWREEWEDQIVDGMIWRLGSNPPTTLETKAGLIFDDTVIFPGNYNLGIICRNSEEWDIVAHSDGLEYKAGPHHGMTSFELDQLPAEKASQRLEIELTQGSPQHSMRITLGRRNLVKAFRTAVGKTTKGKVGKHAFTSTWLERTDLEELEKAVVEDEVCVCRIDSKDLTYPVRAYLRGGESAELMIRKAEDWRAPLVLEGRVRSAQNEARSLTHTIRSGKESALLGFAVGDQVYEFDLPARLFEKAGNRD